MFDRFFIFGDSYSTFKDYIPEGYAFYYSEQGDPEKPVKKMTVDQTWWKRLVDKTGATLVQNNSWSGSTICYTSLHGEDCSTTSSFIYRLEQLAKANYFEANPVDTVLVLGATNDNWGLSPLGQPKYSDWEKQDLYYALPAVSYFIHILKNTLPNARIVFIINTDFKPQLVETIKTSCDLYKIEYLELAPVDKQMGHPTPKGMQQICDQVIEHLNK